MSKLGESRHRMDDAVTRAEEKLKRMNDKEMLKALTTKRNQEMVRAYDLLRRAAKEIKEMDRLAGFRGGLVSYQRRVDLVGEIEELLVEKI